MTEQTTLVAHRYRKLHEVLRKGPKVYLLVMGPFLPDSYPTTRIRTDCFQFVYLTP